jgi:hypothetical protein
MLRDIQLGGVGGMLNDICTRAAGGVHGKRMNLALLCCEEILKNNTE